MYFVINKTKGNISYPLTEGFLQVKPGSNQIADAVWGFVKKSFNMVKVQIETDCIEEQYVEDVAPTESASAKKNNPLLGVSKSQARKIIKNTFINAELAEMSEGVDDDTLKLINAQIKVNNGEKAK